MPDEQGPWWRAPAIVAAVVTGLFGVWVTLLKNDDGGKEDGAAALHVSEVRLVSSSSEFLSRCPLTIPFLGEIDVDAGHGRLVYRFRYSDGFNNPEQLGPIQEAAVDGPRTVPVSFTWTPDIPVGRVARTVKLELLRPATLVSNAVTVRGTCDARLPPGPPEPPPQVPEGPPGGGR